MMTPAVSARCAERLIFTAHPRVPIHPLFRAYASQSGVGAGSPSRKQVTIANDDGRVTWANLSIREKAARTTQQTFNLGVVLAGVIMTVYLPEISHLLLVLIRGREVSRTFFTRKSFLRIVKSAISIVQLMRSRPVLELESSLDLPVKSRPLVSRPAVGGLGRNLFGEDGFTSLNL